MSSNVSMHEQIMCGSFIYSADVFARVHIWGQARKGLVRSSTRNVVYFAFVAQYSSQNRSSLFYSNNVLKMMIIFCPPCSTVVPKSIARTTLRMIHQLMSVTYCVSPISRIYNFHIFCSILVDRGSPQYFVTRLVSRESLLIVAGHLAPLTTWSVRSMGWLNSAEKHTTLSEA